MTGSLRSDPWPRTLDELAMVQAELGRASPDPWVPPPALDGVAGCFVCFERGQTGRGAAGDRAWAAASLLEGGTARTVLVRGTAGSPYVPGSLALREGPLLEAAVLALPARPRLLLVDATGRDHPLRGGLALHLGARLGVPTVGVTNRPLLATGPAPADARGASCPLQIGDEVVGRWVRTRRGTRPLAAHAAWRTSPDVAAAVLLAQTDRWRTPLPLRLAREAAREARAKDAGATRRSDGPLTDTTDGPPGAG